MKYLMLVALAFLQSACGSPMQEAANPSIAVTDDVEANTSTRSSESAAGPVDGKRERSVTSDAADSAEVSLGRETAVDPSRAQVIAAIRGYLAAGMVREDGMTEAEASGTANIWTAGLKIGQTACFPAQWRSRNEFVVMAEILPTTDEGRSRWEEVPMKRLADGSWSTIENDPDDRGPKTFQAECPSPEVAEPLLRRIRRDPKLRVNREQMPSRGRFTDRRGPGDHEEGPMRLRCRYELGATVAGGEPEEVIAAYAWINSGKYAIDQDLEVWSD